MDRNDVLAISAVLELVALRKESVDRNCWRCHSRRSSIPSLSARRAWIEISGSLDDILASVVALRKESVDRNSIAPGTSVFRGCRSPQGERG